MQPHPGFDTLISSAQFKQLQSRTAPLQLWDCTANLTSPQAARAAYENTHIVGATFVDLDTDLSDKTGAADKASAGRHPLPSPMKFAAWLGAKGVTQDTQVVVYDRNGCNFCGRAWWMLRWLGHKRVAVLDGGMQAWIQSGGAVAAGADHSQPDFSRPHYPLALENNALAAIDFVVNMQQAGRATIIDARAPERFRGETEPLDAVAGHIPGALNRPFTRNFDPQGLFKTPQVLRQEFAALLGPRDANNVIHHCGSGVSAVPNVLAMALAGYPPSQLFAGSWSEWSNRADLPVAQG